jgi:N-acetylmuramoyl-L-alanine amidase
LEGTFKRGSAWARPAALAPASRHLCATLLAMLACLAVPPLWASPPDSATLLWRGESHPVATAGPGEFRIVDVAKALGFEVTTDATTGVLTLSAGGHQIFVGVGTTQVPVDQRIVQISRPARSVGGSLYAPADFFEKTLFPLVGATGAFDPVRRTWVLTETTPSLALDVAVVHVEPTTQIVIKESASARFVPILSDAGVQIRWPGLRITPPFPERRYDDPFVSAIRFAADSATIEFREKGLTARVYPLAGPDRLVVEIGRPSPGGVAPPLAAATAPGPAFTIVIDAGHGGSETGAIGPAGLQEKEVTLEIARRLAAAIPRVLSCRVVLTRDSDNAISLDDRTAVANHEKADLFLSVHANSSRAAGAHGSETYYLSLEASDRHSQEVASQENQAGTASSPAPGGSPRTPELDFILWDIAQSAHLKESSELAETIQNELNVVSKTENRGIKQAPFRVLVGATMPAVLVETAFISNPDEEKKLASSVFQQSVADAVAKAISGFFSRRKPTGARTPTPAPTPGTAH